MGLLRYLTFGLIGGDGKIPDAYRSLTFNDWNSNSLRRLDALGGAPMLPVSILF